MISRKESILTKLSISVKGLSSLLTLSWFSFRSMNIVSNIKESQLNWLHLLPCFICMQLFERYLLWVYFLLISNSFAHKYSRLSSCFSLMATIERSFSVELLFEFATCCWCSVINIFSNCSRNTMGATPTGQFTWMIAKINWFKQFETICTLKLEWPANQIEMPNGRSVSHSHSHPYSHRTFP